MNDNMIYIYVILPTIAIPHVWVKNSSHPLLQLLSIFVCTMIGVILFHIYRWDIVSFYTRYLCIILYTLLSAIILVSIWKRCIYKYHKIALLVFIPFWLICEFGLHFFITVVDDKNTAAIELGWPLGKGTYYIAQGGDLNVINNHRRANAQASALDITKLDKFGRRARGIMPTSLEDYMIFNEPIYAPCSGEIVLLVEEFPNESIGEQDSDNPAGNSVMIHCKGSTVLLAHMTEVDSIEVGQKVITGTKLGKVGNSGNTTEPHLHIHAVKGRSTMLQQQLISGVPIKMNFNGKLLKKNDIFNLNW